MAVRIRPLTLDDTASYNACVDTVAKERRHFSMFEAAPLAEVRKRMRKRLRGKIPFLVAVDGARVVGWAAVFRPDLPSLNHNGDVVIGLLQEYRGIGLGTKLMTGVLKMSKGKFESLLFCVFSKNKPARKLGKKMGFKQCGREKNFVKLAYGVDDQLILQKLIRG